MATQSPHIATAFSLLRHPEFRRLWCAGLCAALIRWLELLVVSVYVYDVTNSAFLVAFIAIVRLLPLSIFSTLAGVLGDRLNRRSILLVGLALMAIQSLIVYVLASADWLEVWHLMFAVLLTGAYWAVDMPVRRTLLAEIAGPAAVGQAMSLESVTNNAMRMTGPLLGGAAMLFLGIEGAYLLGVSLYVAATLIVLGTQNYPSNVTKLQKTVFANLTESWRLVLRNRLLLATLSVTVIFNVWVYPFTAMVPVIGRDVLNLDGFEVGLIVSAEGMGAMLGSILSLVAARPAYYRQFYVGGVLISIFSVLFFSQASWAPLAGFCLLIAGLGNACFSSMQPSLVFLLSPPDSRARLMGVLSFCIGTSPLGFLLVGALADVLDPSAAVALLVSAGFVALTAACMVWRELLARGQVSSAM